MTREEAIKRIKERIAKEAWCTDDEDKDALATLIPELAESDDEKIKNIITDSIFYQYGAGDEYKDVLDYLDKLEKQKDASKAIDRIDKYIKYVRAHTANAHDMDDTNPDKKYYIGVDDTLSNIAGILNSAYSEEEQKEQKDYRKLYEDIAESEWFKKNYVGKSLGENPYDFAMSQQERQSKDEKTVQLIKKVLYDSKNGVEHMIGDTDYYKCLAWLERKKEYRIQNTVALEKWLKESVSRFISQLEYGSTIDIDTLISDMRNQDFYKECRSIEDIAKDITKDRETVTTFLKNAGIIDENGELVEKYRTGEKKEQKSTEYPICKETEDKSHINWSHLEECPKEDEYEVVEKGDATGLKRKKSTEYISDTANFDEGFKTGHEVGFREGVKSVKPVEWSEEDKRALNNAIVALSMYTNGEIPYLLPSQLLEDVERLKSLRPQSNLEWSEEDEKIRQSIIKDIEWERNYTFATTGKTDKVIEKYNEQIAWLNSLRPHWKPSKEQMEQLNSAADLPEFGPMVTTRKQFPDLESLYNELLKNYKL